MTAIATKAPWRNRIVGTSLEPPEKLVANPANWRTHPDRQRDALRGSLGTVGWVQQVMVNDRTGFVVDGHARLEEALRKGELVPVLHVDLSPEEEALVLATLDPIGAMAETNRDALDALLADVTVDDAGLASLLADLAGSKVGLTDPDDVPETPADPWVKPGDLFALGDHRLMCGDSRDGEMVTRLLDGGTPRLLVTDPPYGVELDMEWRDRAGYNGMGPAERSYMKQQDTLKKRGGAGVSGDTITDWSPAFALVPSLEVAYVWHATTGMIEVAQGLQAIGFEIRQQLIWMKTQAAMSRSAYNWQHEPCWYAVRKGKTADWIGPHMQTTVWEYASPKQIMGGSKEAKVDHPTQKPIGCMSTPISNHRGDVYEPFSGSGTTIIAAEQLGRRCYAMEIEPKYVQVAIERWQAFTGQEAVRAAA